MSKVSKIHPFNIPNQLERFNKLNLLLVFFFTFLEGTSKIRVKNP